MGFFFSLSLYRREKEEEELIAQIIREKEAASEMSKLHTETKLEKLSEIEVMHDNKYLHDGYSFEFSNTFQFPLLHLPEFVNFHFAHKGEKPSYF